MSNTPGDVQRMLPKSILLNGRWYVGRGRGDPKIARWDAEFEHFTFPCTESTKFGRGPRDWYTYMGLKSGAHFDDWGGCFQPFRLIEEPAAIESPTEPFDRRPMQPRSALLTGRWYVGLSQSRSRIGLWDASLELFVFADEPKVWSGKDPSTWHKYMGLTQGAHFDDDSSGFRPFHLVDEGVVVEPHEEIGYAISLRFGYR